MQMEFDIVGFLVNYVLPMQLTIGLIGNTFNLIVLLSKGMRSKTNTVLAVMALADMLFLIFMIPHSIISNEKLRRIPEVKSVIVYMHLHFNGIVNMCSFASAWLIVMVSFERMTAVIWPLRARTFWTNRMLCVFVIGIWICAALITMHWHVTHHVVPGVRKNEIKNETTGEITVTETPLLKVVLLDGFQKYWKIGLLCEMIMTVFVPVILVLSSNILMILALREQNRTHDVRIKRQRRATLIVFIIASTFAVCQIPSAIVHIVEQIWPYLRPELGFRTAATFTNSLVVTGKTANFFLFCTWSSYFRKNLKRAIASKMPFLYNVFGKSIGRIKSTSRIRNSKNQLIEKLGAQRLQSQPPTTRLEYSPEGLRVNHSYPLTNHSTYPKAEDTFIYHMGEDITFLTNDANVIAPVTKL